MRQGAPCAVPLRAARGAAVEPRQSRSPSAATPCACSQRAVAARGARSAGWHTRTRARRWRRPLPTPTRGGRHARQRPPAPDGSHPSGRGVGRATSGTPRRAAAAARPSTRRRRRRCHRLHHHSPPPLWGYQLTRSVLVARQHYHPSEAGSPAAGSPAAGCLAVGCQVRRQAARRARHCRTTLARVQDPIPCRRRRGQLSMPLPPGRGILRSYNLAVRWPRRRRRTRSCSARYESRSRWRRGRRRLPLRPSRRG